MEDTALSLKELPGVRTWGPGHLAWVGRLEGQRVPAAHWAPQRPTHSLVLTSDTPTLTLPSLVPWSMEPTHPPSPRMPLAHQHFQPRLLPGALALLPWGAVGEGRRL